MRKHDLADFRKREPEALREQVKRLRMEIADLLVEKSSGSTKDIKTVSKKRRDLAQILTILRQKELLAELERIEEPKEKGKIA